MAHPDLQYLQDDAPEAEAKRSRTGSLSLYHLLVSRRWFVAKGLVAGLLVGAAVAFLIPPKYESVAQLMPPDQDSTAATMIMSAVADRAQNLVGLPGDLFGAKTSGALFSRILTSETSEDALIHKLNLQQVYSERYMDSARKKLESNTEITEDRKSGVISIRVRDRDRARAKAICEAYLEQLNGLSAKLSTSAARREREFLERRLAILKTELDASANALAQFSSKNATLDLSQQAKTEVEAAADLQGQLIAAQAELDGLKQIYTDQNIRVRSLQGRVVELRRNLRLLTGQDAGVADGAAGDDRGIAYPSLRKLPLLGVTYTDLYRRAKINEAVFETLTKQYEIAKVQEAKDTPTVRVLDPPSYPERHVWPTRKYIVISGGVLGFAFAAVWIVWAAIEPQDPTKQLVMETYNVIRDDFVRARRRRSAVKEQSS